MKKSIKLQKAWKVDSNLRIEEGLGFKFPELNWGMYETLNKEVFTSDGDEYFIEGAESRIFFDLDIAIYWVNKEKENHIKYLKEQIKHYQNELTRFNEEEIK